MESPVDYLKQKGGSPRRPVVRELSSRVAVCLTYQPLVPVCIRAIADCLKLRSADDHRISFDARIENQLKVWLDAPLFNEALAGLLKFADDHAEETSRISFSINYDGMNDCRIMIAFPMKTGKNEPDDDPFAHTRVRTGRMDAIISQHRMAMDISRNNRQVVIRLQFRN